jgi:hypothetical protein
LPLVVEMSPQVRTDKFEETQFLRDLVNLKDTQEAIQSLSHWCMRNRRHSYKIARCWLKVSKKATPKGRNQTIDREDGRKQNGF